MSNRKTVCFTGMEPADGERLKQLFVEANRRAGDAWTLTSDTDADMLIIDVDSMYGHMTWLKLHHSGRIVVALSSSEKADSDHLLLRPVSADSLARLLADHAGTQVAPTPARQTPAPSPVATPPPERAAARSEPAPAPAATPVAPPVPAPEPVAPTREPMLSDYLQPGALPGPVKYKLGDAPPLVLDPQSRTYLGPAALKGFVPYGKAVIRNDDWTAVTPHELERLKTELGGAQPFVRLQWLAALVASDGRIAPGYDPNQRYKMIKWPQIEREFPKHFRIATAMMKGPQLLTEIADASTVPLPEVTDFVNACLATGMAEMDAPASPQDPNAAAKGGLLGRLRGGR
jgi:hypothetical protein